MRYIWRMNKLLPVLQEIKATRIVQKLSQAELALAAGIARRTYQRLESGDPGTRIDTLFRALNALGLTLKTTPSSRPTLSELNALYGDDA